jgi:predicted alpha/beta-fold hydrolase
MWTSCIRRCRRLRRRARCWCLFHGLEGSSRSHYAEAFADFAQRARLGLCGAAFPRLQRRAQPGPRAYHSGDFEEIGLGAAPPAPAAMQARCWSVGISLGGNALMRWAGELGETGAAPVVHGVASICSPIDLAAGGWAIGQGFNRLVYTRMFLAP